MPRLIEEKRHSEDTGGDVEDPLNVVLDVAEVVPAILAELDDFEDEIKETIQDQKPHTAHLYASGTLIEGLEAGVRTRR